MSPKLQELLYGRYPEIFRDRDGDMYQTAMCWGIACGDGWFGLIDTLCEEIERHVKAANCEQVVAAQVKEKFGTLRFRIHKGDGYIRGLLQMAEALSTRTCEECGGLGGPFSGGRLPTRCADCIGAGSEDPHSNPLIAWDMGENRGLRRTVETSAAGTSDQAFRLPSMGVSGWRPLAAALEEVIDIETGYNGMPPIFVDAVIETETLAFRWHGGDNEGQAAGLFRMVEAYSGRYERTGHRRGVQK